MKAAKRPRVRPWLVAVLLVAIAAGLSVFGWLSMRRPAPRPSPEAARAQRTTPLVEVAPAPLPTSAPLLGGEGTDANAYPLAYVDKPALRSLLWHRKYDDLTRYFDQFEDAFEADFKHEYWPSDAAEAFASAEASLGTRLDGWVAASSNSFAPYLARGSYWLAVAGARRGGEFVKDTPASDLAAMHDALDKASADLTKALSLRPKAVEAMRCQLRVANFAGPRKTVDDIASRAMASCPGCFRFRVSYLIAMTPNWGGSYDAMHAFALKDLALNPKFRVLDGYADLDRSEELRRKKKLDEAQAAAEKALSFGEYWEFLVQRGELREDRKDWDGALSDFNRALALRPGMDPILVQRAYALYGLKRWEEAGKDLLDALRVGPTSSQARNLYPDAVHALVYQGWEYHTAGRRDDALRVYDLAGELAPLDPQVLQRRAAIIIGTDNPDIPALEKAAADSPDDLRLHQQLDYSLAKQGNFTRVVEMWTSYIARHPDDGRAYMERAGAYFHLGKRAEASADANKACDLGVTEGCARGGATPTQ